MLAEEEFDDMGTCIENIVDQCFNRTTEERYVFGD